MGGEEIQREARGGPWRRTRLVATLLGALALGLTISATAGAQSQTEAKKVREIPVTSEDTPVTQPEGVVYHGNTRAFYGGSSDIVIQDGATVYKAKLNGELETFMPPGFDGAGNEDPERRQTQGFNVDNKDRLYIAGVNTGLLHVYQLPAGNKIATFDVNEIVDPNDPTNLVPPNINDVTIGKNGDVYFTDSDRPFVYRATREQVESGAGVSGNPPAVPQAIDIDPPVDYEKSMRTTNPLEANGIRFTPNDRFVIFNSLNNGELYRLTPLKGDFEPGSIVPGEDIIETIQGPTPAQVGNADGLEFLPGGNILYSVDNSSQTSAPSTDESPERIVKLRLSNNYLRAQVIEETTSPEFHSPTALSLVPNGRILVNNSEFFESDEDPRFFVLRISRP